MGGQSFAAPCGYTIKMDETNHHLWKPVFIGEVRADGQFNVVWKTKGPVRAQPWSPFVWKTKGPVRAQPWSPFIAGNEKKPNSPA
ncbi:MAG: urtA [Burkholderiaceae bacterium]|nr:urtA [Burkholderiaceae bacterium]